jgi:hypothetical protein
MQARTRATLAEFDSAAWFRAVGLPVEGPFVILSSWEDAIASCTSSEWEELLLEASNRYTDLLASKAPARFQSWNQVVVELKALTEPLVSRKVATVLEEHDLLKEFVDSVQWDILGACMEAEFADVQPPGFFASQAFWYVQGHFPCGWKGDFPDGRLILY